MNALLSGLVHYSTLQRTPLPITNLGTPMRRFPLAQSLIPVTVLLLFAGRLAAQPTVWHQVGVGGGGALYHPTINPHNNDDLWLSCDMGEVFHSLDFGTSWTTIPFRERTGNGNGGSNIFTGNPNIIYSIAPIRRSIDGGVSWNTVAGDPLGSDVITLYADYDAPDRIVVSGYYDVYFSNDGGATFSSAFHTESDNGVRVGGVLFAGSTIIIGTNQGEIVSKNGGTSFKPSDPQGIPSDEAIVSMGVGQTAQGWKLYAITQPADEVYGEGIVDPHLFSGVYTRTEASDWTACGALPQGVHPSFAEGTHTSTDVVYVAGGGSDDAPTVYKSIDGGATWTDCFHSTMNGNIATGWSGDGGDRQWSFGEYALGFGVAQNTPNRLAITDFGFIHVSSDGGTTWKAVYTDPRDVNPSGSATPSRRAYRTNGLENTAVWHLCWTDSSHIWAGFTDIRGIRTTDGGTSWSFDYTGNTSNTTYQVVRSGDGTLYAASSSIHDMYQSTYLQDSRIDRGSGAVLRSTDNGVNWETIYNAGHPVYWIALDPRNNGRAIASVIHSTEGGIFLTENIAAGTGATWTRLSAPTRTEGHPAQCTILDDGTIVAVYSGRRNSSGAFTASSGVFVSNDNGASWQDRTDTKMRYWTRDLVIDPHDPQQNTWYACVFSGWGGPPNDLHGLYRTVDRGATWTQISEIRQVASCTIDPRHRNVMYLTTEEDGLWYSNNATDPSPTFTQVESYPFHFPMRVFFDPYDTNKVWVASFGNGIRWGTTATSLPSSVDETTPLPLLSVLPQPAADRALLRFSEPLRSNGTLHLINARGTLVQTLEMTSGSSAVEMPLATQPSGRYVLELRSGGRTTRTSLTVVR